MFRTNIRCDLAPSQQKSSSYSASARHGSACSKRVKGLRRIIRLSTLIFTRWVRFARGVAQAGMVLVLGPPCHCSVTKAPTARCTSAAILGRAQPEWGQARSSQPLQIRSPDLRSRNWADIGCRIDAPGDGRAPDRDCFSNALGPPRRSFTPPFFCLSFFCHSYFHFLSPISAITKKSFVGSFG